MYLSRLRPLKMLFSEPEMFKYMYIKWLWKIAYTKLTKRVIKPRHYAGKFVTPDYEGNEKIKELISSGKPFLEFPSEENYINAYAEFYNSL